MDLIKLLKEGLGSELANRLNLTDEQRGLLSVLFGVGAKPKAKRKSKGSTATGPGNANSVSDEAQEEAEDASPTLIPVQSSNVQGVNYSFSREVLIVQFKDDRVYEYSGVPSGIFYSFLSAPSKGKFVWGYLRDKYPARQVY